MSVISLMNRYFEGGITKLAQLFIDHYRSMIAFFLDPLLAFLPFSVPAWYRDMYVISFCMIILAYKAGLLAELKTGPIPGVEPSLSPASCAFPREIAFGAYLSAGGRSARKPDRLHVA
jgi:hypothetical protein